MSYTDKQLKILRQLALSHEPTEAFKKNNALALGPDDTIILAESLETLFDVLQGQPAGMDTGEAGTEKVIQALGRFIQHNVRIVLQEEGLIR